MNIKKLLKSFILSIIIFLGLDYFWLMPINIYFFGTILTFIIIFTIIFNFDKNNKQQKFVYNNLRNFSLRNFFQKSFNAKVNSVLVIFIVGYLVISFFSSTIILHSNAYANLIGDVGEEKDFVSEFSQVDQNNLPVVDHDLAIQLGDKEFGKYGSLGSQFHLGTFNDLQVVDNLYSVAPLEYNGFFQWINNLDGAPGYCKVDKVSMKTTINNDSLFKYTESAYFNSNIKRHIYFNGGMFYKLDAFSVELDENNNPYWVVSAELPKIGLSGGYDVVGVFIVNPTTGETNYYKVGEIPAWVDTVYPKDIIIDQLDDYGMYQDGFLNSIFAKRNCLTTTYGSRRVYDEKNVYHYTGLTSISSDEATVGFVFVNTNTKEVTRYSMSGATEYAAMRSAEGKVQNYGYTSTFPIPINLYNELTFFITLKDTKGLIKQYAFVNIDEFSTVGIGDTIDAAKNDYAEKIQPDISVIDDDKIVKISGTVIRINTVIVNGESYYYLLLDDENIYKLPLRINDALAITKAGDSVIISSLNDNYIDFSNTTINK